MFTKLFAESGLSLDRLRALLAVAAAGSIVKATDGDPVRQSQYSRQIKELENFFRIKLVERHGKGIRLTPHGRELARISRFFMLGLSNFQRGCLVEKQTFRVAASATFACRCLVPAASTARALARGTRYLVETATADEIERRLHDLTLDFGVTTQAEISRPLQLSELAKWRLKLWVPNALAKSRRSVAAALKEGTLPLALARKELVACGADLLEDYEPRLIGESFLEACAALEQGSLGAVLPDFLTPASNAKGLTAVRIPFLESRVHHFRLAWNPRLLRLNPHAIRGRDFLGEILKRQMRGE